MSSFQFLLHLEAILKGFKKIQEQSLQKIHVFMDLSLRQIIWHRP